MKLLKKIVTRLNGLHYPQEYLCFAWESFQHPLQVFLAVNGKIIKDITHSHLFTGYSPLIVTLYSPANNNQELPADIDIVYTPQPLQPNDHFEKKGCHCSAFPENDQEATGRRDRHLLLRRR